MFAEVDAGHHAANTPTSKGMAAPKTLISGSITGMIERFWLVPGGGGRWNPP